jgi:hypothetical protein
MRCRFAAGIQDDNPDLVLQGTQELDQGPFSQGERTNRGPLRRHYVPSREVESRAALKQDLLAFQAVATEMNDLRLVPQDLTEQPVQVRSEYWDQLKAFAIFGGLDLGPDLLELLVELQQRGVRWIGGQKENSDLGHLAASLPFMHVIERQRRIAINTTRRNCNPQ